MTTRRLLAPLRELRAVEDSPGTFDGYGSVFGVTDSYGDVVAKGAFKKTLRQWKAERGKFPPMLLQHGGGGFFGGAADDLVPVGVWDEMREDDTGLYVKGRLLALDTDRGKSIYAAMREGALDGLSIGFVTREAAYGKEPDEPQRTIKAVDLWEVSVVTFPANGDARVNEVRGIDLTEREFEEWLTRAGGFSRAQAKAIVAKGFRRLTREAEQPDQREAGTRSAQDAAEIIRRYYAA